MQLKKQEILIRADGGPSIGLGHLVRCLALAHMLRSDYIIHFINVKIPDAVKSEIIQSGFKQTTITTEQDFFNQIQKDRIVVVDHYDFTSEDQEKVKRIGAKLVCIDDLHSKVFFADLIINHAPDIKPEDYHAQSYTKYALGLDYALLRPAFLEAAMQSKKERSSETVFICFGGADILNYTQRALQAVIEQGSFKRIIVIAGSAYGYTKELEEQAQKYVGVEVYQAINEYNILKLMLESALAIVPASGILLEALTAKCKVISGMYVENQKLLFNAYKNMGIITSAENFSKEDLKIALMRVFSNDYQKHNVIDGKSGERLRRHFKLLSQDLNCSLRKADKDDLQTTFNWAKNKTIRAFSFSRNEISFKEHERWFLNKITDNNCYYLIFESGNQPAGSIRFDKVGNKAVISYLLDPEFHGKGLGTTLLKLGIEWLCNKKDKHIYQIVGDVMDNNIPSIKAFESLNFTKEFLNASTIRFNIHIDENRK